jgi:hypothetical protein
MYALALSVASGLNAKVHLSGDRRVDGDRVDAVGLLAVDKKDIRLSVVPAKERLSRVAADAPRREDHGAIAQPACLALRTHESIVRVNHKVVPLVDAERNEHAIATLDQSREDRHLAAKPNIHRMVGQLWRRTESGH